jgi:hypothetical protein
MLSGTLTATNQVIAQGPYWLKDITLADTSGSANQISIYDTNRTDGGATPYGPAQGAHTGASVTATEVTNEWTDFLGNDHTEDNDILEVDNAVVVGAVANPSAKKLVTLLVPANGTVTYTPDPGPAGFTYGIMIRAAGTAAYAANVGQLP